MPSMMMVVMMMTIMMIVMVVLLMLWDDEEDYDSELWKQNGQVWGPWHWRVSFYDEFSKKMEDFYAKMSLQRHFPCGDCARKTCGTPNGAVNWNDTIWPFSSRLIVSKRSIILPGDNRQTVSELSCRTPVTHFREYLMQFPVTKVDWFQYNGFPTTTGWWRCWWQASNHLLSIVSEPHIQRLFELPSSSLSFYNQHDQ